MSLLECKIQQAAYEGNDIESISENNIIGRAEWLKARFDALSKNAVIPAHNGLIDALTAPGAAAQIGASGGSVEECLGEVAQQAQAAVKTAQQAELQSRDAVLRANQAEETAMSSQMAVDEMRSMESPISGELMPLSAILFELYDQTIQRDTQIDTARKTAEIAVGAAREAQQTASWCVQNMENMQMINPETGKEDSLQNILYLLYSLSGMGGMTVEAFHLLALTAGQMNEKAVTVAQMHRNGIVG